jgi:Tol biopolymer transport system component
MMIVQSPPKVLRYAPITNSGTRKLGLCTDGLRLYYLETKNGQGLGLTLVQVSVNGGDAAQIPSPVENPLVTDISPNRTELLVRSIYSNVAPFWVMKLPGGESRRLGDVEADAASWSSDSKGIIYTKGHDLYIAKADGSESKKLASMQGYATWVPRLSPDGKVIRFSVSDLKGFVSLWEINLDGSNPHVMFPDVNKERLECCPTWTPDGKYFLFVRGARDQYDEAHIWVLRENKNPLRRGVPQPTQLTSGPLNYNEPQLSPDGKRLFVMGFNHRGELMRYDHAAHRFIPFLSGISADGVNISRDGKWMVYVSLKERMLWRSRTDASQRFQLTSPPLRDVDWPQLSPDEKWVVFLGSTGHQTFKLYRVSTDGGSVEQLIGGEGQELAPAAWSPDGHSLVYAAISTSGESLSLLDWATRQTSTLPGSAGFVLPSWSPDGRFITATDTAMHKLMMFDVARRTWSVFFDARSGSIYHPMWSRDGKYIYFSDPVHAGTPFYRLRIADRKLEQVSIEDFPAGPYSYGPSLWTGLSPDDSPLLLRDTSFDEVFALDVDFP